MTVTFPRKRLLRAHGQSVVFVKNPLESPQHVLMKAYLWALYLPQYPDLYVETKIGDKYKPDVVQLAADGRPVFWGESGQVSVKKIESLVRRFPDTHFAIAKWETNLKPVAAIIAEALAGRPRAAPFDLIRFNADSAARFIDGEGNVRLTHADLEWQRFP
jgi:hypothetical protein